MSATPTEMAEELNTFASEQEGASARQSSPGMASAYLNEAMLLRAAAALIRAQADALKRIAEMDGDQPARSDWDMVRIARAALKAAP